jgi:DmsE family decaheme c-type cytochrome
MNPQPMRPTMSGRSRPVWAAVALFALLSATALAARAGPARASAVASSAAGPVTSSAISPYSANGADTCLNCHNDPDLMGIFRTAHARPNDPRGPFGHGGLQCEACHGPGGAHVKIHGRQPAGIVDFGPGARAPVARQNEMCLACHRSNAAHDWGASAHAANDVGCANCHQLHLPRDPVQQTAAQIDVCGKCHQAERADLLKPSHHPLIEEKMACTSCHSPHGSTAHASLVKDTVNETCTTCHAQFRGPFLWEHQPVTEDCDNCHQPHGTALPALLKSRPPFLCQQCHESLGHPSMPNTPAELAGAAASPFLLGGSCVNCHSQVHGSNNPSGSTLMR